MQKTSKRCGGIEKFFFDHHTFFLIFFHNIAGSNVMYEEIICKSDLPGLFRNEFCPGTYCHQARALPSKSEGNGSYYCLGGQ